MKGNEKIGLDRFKVDFEKANDIKLTDIAFRCKGVQPVLEYIGKIKFEEKELAETKDILWEVQDRIASDEKVTAYLKSTRDNVDNIKKNIESLINKLLKRERDASNRRASDGELKQNCDNVLIGLRIIAEVLRDSEASSNTITTTSQGLENTTESIEKEMIQGSLKMISEASGVCMTGCKNMVETLLTSFAEKISQKFEGIGEIDDEQNELKKVLKKIFYEARVSVSRRIITEFLEEIGFNGGDEPHYKTLCIEVLNNELKFNLPNINLVDTLYTDDQKQAIKNRFIGFVERRDIDLLIYNKACELFHDEFQNNKILFRCLYIWVDSYMKKNNLLEHVGDLSSFMSEYLMIGEYDEDPRYVVLEEIIKDYGFIEVKAVKHKASQEEIDRILHDVKSEQAIVHFNEMLSRNVTVSENILLNGKSLNRFMLEALVRTKRYDILKREALQRVMEQQPGELAFICLLKTKQMDLVTEDFVKKLKLTCESDNKLILEICQDREEAQIQFLEDYVTNLDKKIINHQTMLMYAIESMIPKEMIKWLIDHLNFIPLSGYFDAIDLNKQDNNHKTALMYAMEVGFYDIANYLIDRGADVELKDNAQQSALLYAIALQAPKPLIEKLLIQSHNYSDSFQVDDKGRTLLMWALHLGVSDGIINKLLNFEIKTKKDFSGKTVLMYALEAGVPEGVLHRLIDLGLDIDSTDAQGTTVLMYALKAGVSEAIIHRLIDRGIDLDGTDSKGRTSLIYAILKGASTPLIYRLIDKGVNVNRSDKNGKTALVYALIKKRPTEVLSKLLKHQAKIFGWMFLGKITPFVYAIFAGYPLEVAKSLLKKGESIRDLLLGKEIASWRNEDADLLESVINYCVMDDEVNSRPRRTKLMYALKCNITENMLERLVRRGMALQEKDDSDNTALMYIIHEKCSYRYPVVKYLISHHRNIINEQNDKGFTPLMLAVGYNHEGMINILLGAHVDVNMEGKCGDTALMIAARRGITSTLMMLLKAGAEVNRENKNGDTALIAAANANTDTLENINLLLKAGAEVNKVNKDGNTAVMLAAKHGKTRVVKVLLKAGAEMNRENSDGDTVLTLAAKYGNVDVVRQLMARIEMGREDKDKIFMQIKIAKLDKRMIHVAKYGNTVTMRALLKSVVDVNSHDKNGWTPLMHFLQGSNLREYAEGIELFLEFGALMNLKNNEGKTALDMIEENGFSLDEGLKDRIKNRLKEEIGVRAYQELQEKIKAKEIKNYLEAVDSNGNSTSYVSRSTLNIVTKQDMLHAIQQTKQNEMLTQDRKKNQKIKLQQEMVKLIKKIQAQLKEKEEKGNEEIVDMDMDMDMNMTMDREEPNVEQEIQQRREEDRVAARGRNRRRGLQVMWRNPMAIPIVIVNGALQQNQPLQMVQLRNWDERPPPPLIQIRAPPHLPPQVEAQVQLVRQGRIQALAQAQAQLAQLQLVRQGRVQRRIQAQAQAQAQLQAQLAQLQAAQALAAQIQEPPRGLHRAQPMPQQQQQRMEMQPMPQQQQPRMEMQPMPQQQQPRMEMQPMPQQQQQRMQIQPMPQQQQQRMQIQPMPQQQQQRMEMQPMPQQQQQRMEMQPMPQQQQQRMQIQPMPQQQQQRMQMQPMPQQQQQRMQIQPMPQQQQQRMQMQPMPQQQQQRMQMQPMPQQQIPLPPQMQVIQQVQNMPQQQIPPPQMRQQVLQVQGIPPAGRRRGREEEDIPELEENEARRRRLE